MIQVGIKNHFQILSLQDSCLSSNTFLLDQVWDGKTGKAIDSIYFDSQRHHWPSTIRWLSLALRHPPASSAASQICPSWSGHTNPDRPEAPLDDYLNFQPSERYFLRLNCELGAHSGCCGSCTVLHRLPQPAMGLFDQLYLQFPCYSLYRHRKSLVWSCHLVKLFERRVHAPNR